MKKLRAAAIMLGIGMGVMVIIEFPEIRRYLKMKRM
jgi:hypothetical protein